MAWKGQENWTTGQSSVNEVRSHDLSIQGNTVECQKRKKKKSDLDCFEFKRNGLSLRNVLKTTWDHLHGTIYVNRNLPKEFKTHSQGAAIPREKLTECCPCACDTKSGWGGEYLRNEVLRPGLYPMETFQMSQASSPCIVVIVAWEALSQGKQLS